MLEIKKEFKDLIPPLTKEEFKQLEDNCLAEGIREKIITWNGFIIDGHNRYEIALKWDLDYETESKSFKDENDVKEWMINNQFGRRNLSNYQRSVLALELEDVFSARAKENLKLSEGKGKQKSAEVKIEPIETRKELAKVANVSHDTIAKVKKIEAVATPEVKAKLSTGEVSINQAYQEIKKEEKKAERIEVIEKQIQDIEQGLLPELEGLFDVISVDPPWPYEGESKKITSFDSVGRRVANPYPEMSIKEIKEIDMPLMDDSVVLLWTTHKFLPDAFEILKEWGMDYKATLVWNKEKIGMGAWFRMQCEFCLVGIKGKPYWNNTTFRDILNEARREHSRKPDSFFEMIEKITLGRRLEYFSREKREGWEVFGNDVNKF
jgi:N6-adenosine-specific RNA methylase IME4/DNA-binding XRE family transcriptional regulator